MRVTPPPRVERMRFCTRCATTTAEPDAQRVPFGFDRVCTRCGMGVMLTAPRKALPGAGAAIVVVTREGRISAVSETAEPMVGEEAGLLGMPIGSALASEEGDDLLARQVARAAGGGREVVEATLTPVPQRGHSPGASHRPDRELRSAARRAPRPRTRVDLEPRRARSRLARCASSCGDFVQERLHGLRKSPQPEKTCKDFFGGGLRA